jgi:hypothetical protein
MTMIAGVTVTTVAAEGAAGDGGRDEPLTGGASRQRIDEQPAASHQVESAEDRAVPIDGELDLLRQFYGAAIDAVRRGAPKHERAAAIRALRRELKAAILAITTRQKNEQASRRAAARHRRELNKPSPGNMG